MPHSRKRKRRASADVKSVQNEFLKLIVAADQVPSKIAAVRQFLQDEHNRKIALFKPLELTQSPNPWDVAVQFESVAVLETMLDALPLHGIRYVERKFNLYEMLTDSRLSFVEILLKKGAQWNLNHVKRLFKDRIQSPTINVPMMMLMLKMIVSRDEHLEYWVQDYLIRFGDQGLLDRALKHHSVFMAFNLHPTAHLKDAAKQPNAQALKSLLSAKIRLDNDRRRNILNIDCCRTEEAMLLLLHHKADPYPVQHVMRSSPIFHAVTKGWNRALKRLIELNSPLVSTLCKTDNERQYTIERESLSFTGADLLGHCKNADCVQTILATKADPFQNSSTQRCAPLQMIMKRAIDETSSIDAARIVLEHAWKSPKINFGMQQMQTLCLCLNRRDDMHCATDVIRSHIAPFLRFTPPVFVYIQERIEQNKTCDDHRKAQILSLFDRY